MRLPGAALLIALGLLLLYLATSGNLDALGKAWNDVITPKGPSTSPIAGTTGILDPSAYHVGMLMHSLDPSVSVVQPGGTN